MVYKRQVAARDVRSDQGGFPRVFVYAEGSAECEEKGEGAI